jgi:LacI family transcriptional regulator
MPPARPRRRAEPGRIPKVALLIETSNAFARGILTGIEHYVRSEGPWNLYLAEGGRGASPPAWLRRWEGDGVIARIENERIAEELVRLRLPVIDVSAGRLVPEFPAITTDNERIARAAYQHFAERGFRRFACCGVEQYPWSVARSTFFDQAVRDAGQQCAHYDAAKFRTEEGDLETDAIAEWLCSLERPVAVFATYDARGQQVLDACRRATLSVPEEVAVLGVDNDELICLLSPPPLSSVIPDTHRAGWCAADLLARIMAGEKVAPERKLIPPIGVQARQSTDTLAVEDARIAAALRFIRERATLGLHVHDVLAQFPMSRRAFEMRMKALIGRSPHEEILRVQLNRARELLSGSKLTLAEIAERCGFRHTEYFTVAFKREIGVAPSQYRKEHGVPR